MDLALFVFSILSLLFGVYWYFLYVPNYKGYVSKDGQMLTKYLNPEALLQLSKQKNNHIWIIDVREEEYFLLGHIPGAKNFPYDKVEQWYSQIPPDKYLILYCDLTLKTQEVIIFLEAKGYERILNWGKYKRWKFDETIEENIII